MRDLPPDVVAYQRTREFSESTVPPHCGASTALHYRILEPVREEHELSRERPGIVEPEVPHEVEPSGSVRFFVEFMRRP
jgi:hypothetical protein